MDGMIVLDGKIGLQGRQKGCQGQIVGQGRKDAKRRTVCKVKNFEYKFEQNVVMESFVGFGDSFVGQEDRSA